MKRTRSALDTDGALRKESCEGWREVKGEIYGVKCSDWGVVPEKMVLGEDLKLPLPVEGAPCAPGEGLSRPRDQPARRP